MLSYLTVGRVGDTSTHAGVVILGRVTGKEPALDTIKIRPASVSNSDPLREDSIPAYLTTVSGDHPPTENLRP